jgi:hypothetical protein
MTLVSFINYPVKSSYNGIKIFKTYASDNIVFKISTSKNIVQYVLRVLKIQVASQAYMLHIYPTLFVSST